LSYYFKKVATEVEAGSGCNRSGLPGELAAVEELLRERLSSEIPLVAELGDYLYKSGGKRFRPALAILFYKLFGARGEREALLELAAALELVHLATLVHDDVIDGSGARRARPALWKVWGNRVAVLEGDFIFSRACSLLDRLEAPLRRLLLEAVEDLLEGELLQEELRRSRRIPTVEEYFAVVRRKTGALISAACLCGALLGDPEASPERLRVVRRAGLKLGTAYQMIDDLLDIFGDGRLGKPTWRDRDGGWITLPFIRLLQCSSPKERERLCLLLQAEALSPEEKEELLRQLRSAKIRESFTLEARALIDEAKRLLEGLGEKGPEGSLFEMMDSVIERIK